MARVPGGPAGEWRAAATPEKTDRSGCPLVEINPEKPGGTPVPRGRGQPAPTIVWTTARTA